MTDKTEFFGLIGFAIAIFAVFAGIGTCTRLCYSDPSDVSIEKEKTEQLRLQLEIEKAKHK